eukprot:CAMPEP_0195064310 /NCGR_PEP_ID=MMETSP0448-20130528/10414_1 /TAXON_ID=66468 /ORGANISM="Heterocapsa triquestra, Strain CCMP 448" /LENGTH=67 /DNA_ID=CAMNT_0040095311 /DNA_START=41 /DNA_END=242 /DNA_ORIENTATION=+
MTAATLQIDELLVLARLEFLELMLGTHGCARALHGPCAQSVMYMSAATQSGVGQRGGRQGVADRKSN